MHQLYKCRQNCKAQKVRLGTQSICQPRQLRPVTRVPLERCTSLRWSCFADQSSSWRSGTVRGFHHHCPECTNCGSAWPYQHYDVSSANLSAWCQWRWTWALGQGHYFDVDTYRYSQGIWFRCTPHNCNVAGSTLRKNLPLFIMEWPSGGRPQTSQHVNHWLDKGC